MKLYVSTDENKVHIESYDKDHFVCFTEYGLTYNRILVFQNDKNMESGGECDKLLLLPMTHINNIWHLMHQLFIAFKYITIKNLNVVNIYPMFFNNFYHRQGNILECQYKDLIFTGMKFDYDKFKEIHTIFSNKKSVQVGELDYVHQDLNFRDQPLIDDFKKYIMSNFGIEYKNNKFKKITFILRRGMREITNIDQVKEMFNTYDIDYVYLEDHSVRDQIETVCNTDILIGVHGAGLAWCIFMKRNSTLIEMYPGNSSTDNYIRWCKIAGIQYKRMHIDITSGSQHEFRKATVNLKKKHINDIKEIIIEQSRTKNHWENRYKRGNNSGLGSYNQLCDFKTEVINDFIQEHGCKTMIDLGCGDGNQIKDLQIEQYVGVDISDLIVFKCKEAYKNDSAKTFYTYSELDYTKKYDIAMSLDVIYHLIDDHVYYKYLNDLFNLATKYVIVYSSDVEKGYNGSHVKHRNFSKDVSVKFPNAKLIEKIPQRYPRQSSADFFMFQLY